MFVEVNAVFKMDSAGALEYILKKLHMVRRCGTLKDSLKDPSKGASKPGQNDALP